MEKWFNRKSLSGWPDENLKKEVLNSSCHLILETVHIVSKDEWCRRCVTSFSKPEQILMLTWTDPQQIIYHILRVFMDFVLDPVFYSRCINKYYLKILMLWKCEESPKEYWRSDHIGTICCDLLKEMKWRTEERNWTHYFMGYNMYNEFNDIYSEEYYIITDLLMHWNITAVRIT